MGQLVATPNDCRFDTDDSAHFVRHFKCTELPQQRVAMSGTGLNSKQIRQTSSLSEVRKLFLSLIVKYGCSDLNYVRAIVAAEHQIDGLELRYIDWLFYYQR
jgi:hypothetical protein